MMEFITADRSLLKKNKVIRRKGNDVLIGARGYGFSRSPTSLSSTSTIYYFFFPVLD